MRKLTASEGMWLTQRGVTDPAARVITKGVLLAANATPDDWMEITDDRARALMAERDAAEAAPGVNTHAAHD